MLKNQNKNCQNLIIRQNFRYETKNIIKYRRVFIVIFDFDFLSVIILIPVS